MMNKLLLALLLTCCGDGPEPAIIVDDRPEAGVPPEALAQKIDKAFGLPTFHAMTQGTIKTVRIRYFNKKTWATEKQACEYVAGFLAHKSEEVFGFQVWSQGVGVPEIECFIDFTDEYKQKLRDEGKPCREGQGRLLIWQTESCFRDASGRWWFVSAFDHFHTSHPEGNRELSKSAKPK